jgi:hypothetical protein
MPTGANVKGLVRELRQKAAEARNMRVTIGFNTDYAAAVHEILTNHHPIGQAKYLHRAVEEIKPRLGGFIAKGNAAGGMAGAIQALEQAAFICMGQAKIYCPIDTGFLRGSATTTAAEPV